MSPYDVWSLVEWTVSHAKARGPDASPPSQLLAPGPCPWLTRGRLPYLPVSTSLCHLMMFGICLGGRFHTQRQGAQTPLLPRSCSPQVLALGLHKEDDGGGTLLPGDTVGAVRVTRVCDILGGGISGSTHPGPEWDELGTSVGGNPPPSPPIPNTL